MLVMRNDNQIFSLDYNPFKRIRTICTFDPEKKSTDFFTSISSERELYSKIIDYSEIKEIFKIEFFATLKDISCHNEYFVVKNISGNIVSLFHYGGELLDWTITGKDEYDKDVKVSEIDKFYIKKTSYSIEENSKGKNKIINEEYIEVSFEEFLQLRDKYDESKI